MQFRNKGGGGVTDFDVENGRRKSIKLSLQEYGTANVKYVYIAD